jgi:hypothetical protein
MLKVIFCLVIVIVTMGAQSPVRGEQVLPDDLQALPVQIAIPINQTNSFVGTGTYLEESNRLYLVTAAHVLYGDDGKLIGTNMLLSTLSRGLNATNKNVYDVNLSMIESLGGLRRHPSRDIAVVYLGFTVTNAQGEPGVGFLGHVRKNTDIGIHLIIFNTRDMCREFKDVAVGNDVIVEGYPLELVVGKDTEIDFDRPLFRKGIVSQKNMKTGRILSDASVFGGNSGGPLLMVEQLTPQVAVYRMVGVVIEFVPTLSRLAPKYGVNNQSFINSGYSVVEPIDYALELIRKPWPL